MLSITTIKEAKTTPEIRINAEMTGLLERIQKSAICLSADMSELISIIKRQDPEYAKQIEEMEK